MLVLRHKYESPNVPGSLLLIDPKQVLEVFNVDDKKNTVQIIFLNGSIKIIRGSNISAYRVVTLLSSVYQKNEFVYEDVEFISTTF